MSLNSATFVGRAGRDAEIRFLESGKQVANFTIAVNRRKRDAEPIWIKVEIWGKPAQIAADYVKKGSLVGLSGEVDLDTWTSKDGTERSQIKLTANDIRLLGSKSDSQQQQRSAPAAGNGFDDEEPPF